MLKRQTRNRFCLCTLNTYERLSAFSGGLPRARFPRRCRYCVYLDERLSAFSGGLRRTAFLGRPPCGGFAVGAAVFHGLKPEAT